MKAVQNLRPALGGIMQMLERGLRNLRALPIRLWPLGSDVRTGQTFLRSDAYADPGSDQNTKIIVLDGMLFLPIIEIDDDKLRAEAELMEHRINFRSDPFLQFGKDKSSSD